VLIGSGKTIHKIKAIRLANIKTTTYEGRSINTLQNSVILLVFQIKKIRNTRFVGNFILNTCRNFFWWWRHYCDVICSQNTDYTFIIFPTSNLS